MKSFIDSHKGLFWYGPVHFLVPTLLIWKFGLIIGLALTPIIFKLAGMLLLTCFQIEIASITEFIFKYQDGRANNNIVGYLILDHISYAEFRSKLLSDANKLMRMRSVIKFFGGFMLWVPSKECIPENQIFKLENSVRTEEEV